MAALITREVFADLLRGYALRIPCRPQDADGGVQLDPDLTPGQILAEVLSILSARSDAGILDGELRVFLDGKPLPGISRLDITGFGSRFHGFRLPLASQT